MSPRYVFALAAGALIIAPRAPVAAQDTLPAPVGARILYDLDLGPLGAGPAPAQLASAVINLPGARWLRLHFDTADLPGPSSLSITSLLDGERQTLDSAGLRDWSRSTAYFNGDILLLELTGDPGAFLRITTIETSTDGDNAPRGDPAQCGICGADDRTPSTEDWSGRLMPAGCTASVFCVDSTLVSAGHCIQAGLVVQFRVPNSTAACSTVNPPVNDQFPISTTLQLNAGIGADWAVLRCGPNGLGQLPFDRYGQFRSIAPAAANLGDPVAIWGFGADLTCARSQTQQRSAGSITARLPTSYQFNAVVRTGSSGSAIIVGDRIVGIVTHCLVGCPNHGTRADRPDFAAARDSLGTCDEPRTITVTSNGADDVPVQLSPPDLAGNADGLTPFTRSYLIGSAVTLTTPAAIASMDFDRWTVDGADAPPGPALAVLVRRAATLCAVYRAHCPCDENADLHLDSQDVFDFLTAFFQGAADFNTDGASDSQDFFDFLACFFAGCP